MPITLYSSQISIKCALLCLHHCLLCTCTFILHRHSKTKSNHEAHRKQCSIVAKDLCTAKNGILKYIYIENQGDYRTLQTHF